MIQQSTHPLSVPSEDGSRTSDSAPPAPPKRRHALAAAIEPLLWSLTEAAAALRVSTRTLKRMAASDELPEGTVVYLARRRLFSRRVLERWVEGGCKAPARKRRHDRTEHQKMM